jgi:hypothetical protein
MMGRVSLRPLVSPEDKLMKTSLFTFLFVVAGLASPLAKAEFTVDELQLASKLAVADFAVKNVQHANHLVGYKIWKSGAESKVKVYVTHNGANLEFNYLCHKHDNDLECHAQ